MPFNRPSLTTINDRVVSDIDARVPDAQPRLRRSLFGIIGRVITGAVHGLYGYLDYLSLQTLPDTADEENFQRHASLRNVTRREAVAASGPVVITGNNDAVLPAGVEWQRSDGVTFTTDAEVTVTNGNAVAIITASTAGQNTNTSSGTSLTLVTTQPGIDTNAIVDIDGLAGGTDIETLESWRARYLARIQKPPQGGARHDYVNWALEVPGVTRAWVYPQEMGIGTVTLRFVRDDDDTIPLPADVETVQDYIDEKRPVTSVPYVVAPVAVPLNFTINLEPNTSLVQQAVQEELADLLLRESEPAGTILISRVREAISIASGESDHVLVSPVADIEHAIGEMAVMGDITWQ